jgi:hypothetical protein
MSMACMGHLRSAKSDLFHQDPVPAPAKRKTLTGRNLISGRTNYITNLNGWGNCTEMQFEL